MRGVLLLVLVALAGTSSAETTAGERMRPRIKAAQTIKQDGTTISSRVTTLNFPAADETCVATAATETQCTASTTFSRFGSCIGDEASCSDAFCSSVDMSCVTTYKPPQSAGYAPTAAGVCGWDTTAFKWVCGDGTRTRSYFPYGAMASIGGGGGDGAFTWNGTTGCSQGTIVSTTCDLTPNSSVARWPSESGSTQYSCEYDFTTFSLTGGTLTCGAAFASATSAPVLGSILVIRVQQSPTITGGTIDMAGKGIQAGTAGTTGTLGARAGGGTGSNAHYLGSAGGTAAVSTAGDGAAGIAAFLGHARPFNLAQLPLGGGGGGGAGSLTAGGASATPALVSFEQMVGGTGGGGGGCANAGSTGAGAAGGRGGGAIFFETGGTWACSGATLTVAGNNGAAGSARGGSGGGGGGGIQVFAAVGGSDSCTYTVTGGSAGARGDATNCGVGAAGGAGAHQTTYVVPF